jgi:hypothetical protein
MWHVIRLRAEIESMPFTSGQRVPIGAALIRRYVGEWFAKLGRWAVSADSRCGEAIVCASLVLGGRS